MVTVWQNACLLLIKYQYNAFPIFGLTDLPNVLLCVACVYMCVGGCAGG